MSIHLGAYAPLSARIRAQRRLRAAPAGQASPSKVFRAGPGAGNRKC
jgi:hypothetical protein